MLTFGNSIIDSYIYIIYLLISENIISNFPIQSICELWIGREINVPVFSQVEKEEDHLQESESGKSL